MLLQFHPMLLSRLARVQSDWGDTRLNNYILEHGYPWLARMPGHERFWSPPVFFPAPNTFAYSDLLLGVAPLYWIWRACGVAPDTSYQLWLLSIGTLNFAAAYALFRRGFACTPLGATVGALLFCFAASRSAQVMHAQLIPVFYIAIALLALAKLYERGKSGAWALAFWGALAAELYTSFYNTWFLCFGLGVAACWSLTMRDLRARLFATVRANALVIAGGALAAAAIAAPLGAHWLAAAHEVGYRRFGNVEPMLPRLQSWVYLGPESWLYARLSGSGFFRSIPTEEEQRIGLGLFTTLCAFAGAFIGRKRASVRVAALTVLTIALVATEWPGGFTLWRAIYPLVPGAAALRAVSRIGIVVLLPASLGVAILLDRLALSLDLARRVRYVRALGTVCVIVMIGAEQVSSARSYDKVRGRERVARIVRQLDARCDAFLYTLIGGTEDPWWYHADAMWASMDSGIPTLDGYSGNQPPQWNFYDIRITSAADDSAMSGRLAAWSSHWALAHRRICRVRLSPLADQ